MSSAHPRNVLTEIQAREIFKLQINHGFSSLHAASIVFATKYHVSPKAIRDIWTGRSWLDATFSLWNENERPQKRIIGRPKGKKDSRPRKSRSDSCSPSPVIICHRPQDSGFEIGGHRNAFPGVAPLADWDHSMSMVAEQRQPILPGCVLSSQGMSSNSSVAPGNWLDHHGVYGSPLIALPHNPLQHWYFQQVQATRVLAEMSAIILQGLTEPWALNLALANPLPESPPPPLSPWNTAAYNQMIHSRTGSWSRI